MDLIRVVGTAIGGVGASLVALTASPLKALLTAGFFVLYRGVEDYLLVPRIVGRWSVARLGSIGHRYPMCTDSVGWAIPRGKRSLVGTNAGDSLIPVWLDWPSSFTLRLDWLFPMQNSVSAQQACYSDVDGHSRE